MVVERLFNKQNCGDRDSSYIDDIRKLRSKHQEQEPETSGVGDKDSSWGLYRSGGLNIRYWKRKHHGLVIGRIKHQEQETEASWVGDRDSSCELHLKWRSKHQEQETETL